MSRELAKTNTIMMCEAGSRLYGTETPDSDRDFLGVMVEPPEYVLGLKKFESWSSPATKGINSPTDQDMTIYSLRKFSGLAIKGNPNLLSLLFVPPAKTQVLTDEWWAVRYSQKEFLSKKIATPFIGYMNSQLSALRGERGAKVHRPDLVEKHGYDTKFAYHAIRLGLQGLEVLKHGLMTLPMDTFHRERLMDIRSGEWSLEEVLGYGDHLRAELTYWEHRSGLPDEPNHARVNEMLKEVHLMYWDRKGMMG